MIPSALNAITEDGRAACRDTAALRQRRGPLHHLRRFAREEDGVILAEFLILLPLLIWTFMALVVYWDTFRTINQAQKASYAISDAISREGDVSTAYVDGLQSVLQLLVPAAPSIRMRVTSFQWDADNNRYVVLFSRSPGGRLPALTATNLWNMRARIPAMANKASVFIVETQVAYDPAFDIGILRMGQTLEYQSFENFIVTRPRYARRICLVGGYCPATM